MNGFVNNRNMRYFISYHWIKIKGRIVAVYRPAAFFNRTSSVMIRFLEDSVDLFKWKFDKHIIPKKLASRLAVSIDLKPLEYFLWGYVKAMVYIWLNNFVPISNV